MTVNTETERCPNGHKFTVEQHEPATVYHVIHCPYCGENIPHESGETETES